MRSQTAAFALVVWVLMAACRWHGGGKPAAVVMEFTGDRGSSSGHDSHDSHNEQLTATGMLRKYFFVQHHSSARDHDERGRGRVAYTSKLQRAVARGQEQLRILEGKEARQARRMHLAVSQAHLAEDVQNVPLPALSTDGGGLDWYNAPGKPWWRHDFNPYPALRRVSGDPIDHTRAPTPYLHPIVPGTTIMVVAGNKEAARESEKEETAANARLETERRRMTDESREREDSSKWDTAGGEGGRGW
eukprot:CAMPEP_0179422642 /NCGR_PEP_ID=MMETSP0799-20121207/10545_1 /TAXON_ID=46947 /ORGANISM="Geminigera cryophila, Strain CCMP2564" /LENGTH=245 /DNA_ID=CAMNT_0021196803 /DNA_START=224 /DNA_END=958 /DNA_ORIENTATION=-